jgi:hypothetical protein
MVCYCKTFLNVCNQQIVISIITSSHKRSYIEYIWMSFPIYWSIGLWVSPSREVHVYLWKFRWRNIVLITTRFFDVEKFISLAPLSLLSWCRHSFPIFDLKIFSLLNFTLSPNRIFIWYLRKWPKRAPIPHKDYRLNLHFFSLSACTLKTMILQQRPLRTVYNYLSLTNSALLTAYAILWCAENLYQKDNFHFLFHTKNNPLLL